MDDNKVDLRKINKSSKLHQVGASVRTYTSRVFIKNDALNRDKKGKFKTGSSSLTTLKKIHWKRVVPLVVLVAITGGFLVFKSNAATNVYGVDVRAEDEQFYVMNATRKNSGVPSLSRRSCMDDVARKWARAMAAANGLSHNLKANAALAAQRCKYKWTSAGENVGYGPTSLAIFDAFYKSKGHRENILNPKYNVVGIGSWRNSKGKLFITHLFMKI